MGIITIIVFIIAAVGATAIFGYAGGLVVIALGVILTNTRNSGNRSLMLVNAIDRVTCSIDNNTAAQIENQRLKEKLREKDTIIIKLQTELKRVTSEQ
ncbi:MAG: hypothetical protein R3Y09_00065 [Clostridia bacterium]